MKMYEVYDKIFSCRNGAMNKMDKTTLKLTSRGTTMKALFLATAFLLATITLADAQATIWKADKTHSNVTFTVTHLMISEVTGSFKDYEVTVTSNGDDFVTASVEAVIKTASVNTDNESRDKHLRSNDFFNADSFPNMTFKSSKIEKSGDATYKIYGDLTIRDASKPVVLDAKYIGKQEAWGTTKMGFKATTTINRFDYGVKWDKKMDAGGFIVSNKVDVTLQMELTKQQPAESKK
jgi:polyisoprenoid-binding protein YceI